MGAILGLVIIFLRDRVPESPRWLLTHGELEEEERVVKAIEGQIASEQGSGSLTAVSKTIKIRPRGHVGFMELAGVMLKKYPRRTVLGVSLIVSQAFLYEGVFFTFPLVLRNFYGVSVNHTAFVYSAVLWSATYSALLVLGRFFEYDRSPADDHGDLHDRRGRPGGVRLSVPGRPPEPDHPDPSLGILAFFFASSAASSALFDRQRDLSDRAAG